MASPSKHLTPRSVEPAHAQPRRGIDTPLVAWAGAVCLTLLTFAVRLWRLGEPKSFAFDETYYAKHGWSLVNNAYVRKATEEADERILSGTYDGIWLDTPEMIAHPEVGKWIIGLGELTFGMDPTGWRMASAVVGALMVLVMCRLATRLTGSVLLGWTAGLLLSLDGLHLVMSRLALLDIFLAFFLLCGVHCVVADRQWLARRIDAHAPVASDGRWASWGPVHWWRPWLVLGGLSFGLAVGTKWSGLYVLALFGLWVWLSSAAVRRGAGVRWATARSALVDGLPAFAHLVVVAGLVYLVSWSGWLVHAEEYEQHLSESQYTLADGGSQWPTALEADASGLGEVSQSLRSLFRYHQDLYTFHTTGLTDSTHTYASHPAGWLLMQRPVGVDAQLDIPPGTDGCRAPEGSSCLRQVLLLGNPILWWGGCVALLASLVLWIGRRDWRFGVPVVGVAATWLPWLPYGNDRTIFVFYAIATLPFVVLSLTLCLGALLGPRPETSPRRTVGAVVGGSFVLAVLVAFFFFWPIWTDQLITHSEWLQRMWLKSWI